MPKTKKKFDWEVYDENEDFFDILTMSRNEMKDYKKSHPNYTLREIEYSDCEDDRGDDSWENNSKKVGNVFRIRVRKR